MFYVKMKYTWDILNRKDVRGNDVTYENSRATEIKIVCKN